MIIIEISNESVKIKIEYDHDRGDLDFLLRESKRKLSDGQSHLKLLIKDRTNHKWLRIE